MKYLTFILTAVVALFAVLAVGHALLYKRDSRAALGWVGFCLAFPIAGPFIYFLFGINRIRTTARKIQDSSVLERPADRRATEDHEADVEARLPEELHGLFYLSGAVARHPLVDGNAVEVLHNGEETYPAMLEAIASARREAWLATYLFDTDSSGLAMIDALARAQERGVSVRVLLDGYGELYSWPRARRLLLRRGIRVVRFLPPAFRPRTWHFNLRNHRKVLVVDGEVAFVGGMNIGDRHLASRRDNPRRVVDLHFRLRGPVVAQVAQVFAEDWEFAAGERLAPPESATAAGEAVCRVITDGPNEDLDRLALLLVGAVAQARRRVTLMTPYFLPSRELIGALETAALRGVEVVVILPGLSNLPFVHWATRNMLWELLQRGVEVVYQPPPFVHSKVFLVDDLYLLVGSFNVDPRSLRLNFELGVEVYAPSLAAELARHCEAVRAVSRRVTLEEVDARPLPSRLRDAVMWLFSPYL